VSAAAAAFEEVVGEEAAADVFRIDGGLGGFAGGWGLLRKDMVVEMAKREAARTAAER
jgi:hypothetical protein